MINRVYFISDSVIPGLSPDLLLRPGQNLQDLYQAVALQPSGSYGLLLKGTESPAFVASFLFLPSYLRTGQGRTVFLTGEAPGLSEYLLEQGLEDVQLTTITSPIQRPADLLQAYPDLLASERPYGHELFVDVDGAHAAAGLANTLQAMEVEFAQSHPAVYALALETIRLEQELGQLSRSQQATAAELSHQKQFVEVLRSSHKILELQDYYNHEYEVLPLWYKRFGHMLKVLMGKRNIRSLFDNKAKKYID